MSKITDLTALTETAATDLLAIVDDVAGTATTKKITVANLLPIQIGQIYVADAAASQTPGVAYAKMTQFAADGITTGDITASHANDKLTLGKTGYYFVSFTCSFEGTGASVVDITVYWNSVRQTQVSIRRKLGVGGDVGSAAGYGLIDATAVDKDVEVYVKCDGAADVFDVIDASLVVMRLGNT